MTTLILTKFLPLLVPMIAGILTNVIVRYATTYSAWFDGQSIVIKRTVVAALSIVFTMVGTATGIELNPDAPFADTAELNALITMGLAHAINKSKSQDRQKKVAQAVSEMSGTNVFDLSGEGQ